jgi:hypothetical protein
MKHFESAPRFSSRIQPRDQRSGETPLSSAAYGKYSYRSDAMERAEADHAKADQVRMARDVVTMFDEMKALADRHAALHAD